MTLFERISNWISPREIEATESILDAETVEALGNILNVPVRKAELFEQALSHRSYLRVNKLSSVKSYERLEFLGDGVVDMIVAEYLYKRFPEGDEGFLTKLRARLVNGQTLAKLCKQTGLDQLILFGPDIESNVQELSETSDNYKSDLLELLQAQGKEQPVYKVVDESGPPHDKVFEIRVLVEKVAYGSGIGKSKKVAEQKAAYETLKVLREKS